MIPPYVRQYAAMPSAAAAMRLKQSQSLPHRTVIGLFNEQLPGATREIATLERLAAEGSIRLDQVTTSEELASALQSRSDDLLSITAHGTRGEGFEFTIDLGSEKLALARLLDMGLPTAVSLGCCWSARSAKSTTSVAAVTSCLLAGASTSRGWTLGYRRCRNGCAVEPRLRTIRGRRPIGLGSALCIPIGR